jgi:hypothetical protein
MIFEIGDFIEERMSKELLLALRSDEDDTIVLIVNSSGGDVLAFMELASVIEELKTNGKRIVTYGLSRVFSAGLCTLLLGDVIYLSKYTMILHHEATPVNRWEAIMNRVKGDEMIDMFNSIVNEVYPKGLMQALEEAKPKPWYKRLFTVVDDYVFTSREFANIYNSTVDALELESFELVCKIGAPLELLDSDMEWFILPTGEPMELSLEQLQQLTSVGCEEGCGEGR